MQNKVNSRNLRVCVSDIAQPSSFLCFSAGLRGMAPLKSSPTNDAMTSLTASRNPLRWHISPRTEDRESGKTYSDLVKRKP